jgi:ribosomal protein S18 acetylase RimI-like enzyme/DNA-binding MarR family transcriptional regulator
MDYIAQLGLVAIASRLRAMSEQMYAIADQVYRSAGVPIQSRWLPVLRMLHDHGPLTIGEVAQAVGQTHSAVSQLADRLIEQDWLRVVDDPHDRRVRRLQITAQAQAQLRAAKPLWRAFQDTYAKHCSDHQIDLLHTLTTFESVLTPTLADTIIARAAANARGALRIVPFESKHRAHFYRLNEAWLRKYFYVEEIDHRVLSDPEGEIIARGGTILFAAQGEEIVGTCALMPHDDGSVELTKMGVDEHSQGLGVGRALLEAAIAAYQRLAGHRLFLETNSKLAPALRLYESMGFERQASIKTDSHYARADVYMVWRDTRQAPGATQRGRSAPRTRRGT